MTVPARQNFRSNNITIQHNTTPGENLSENSNRGILISLGNTQHNAPTQHFDHKLYQFENSQPAVSQMNSMAPSFVTNRMVTVPYVAPQLPPVASLLPPEFRISQMSLNMRGQLDSSPAPPLRTHSNYRGERNSRLIRCLPDHANCALFITNIPVEVSIAEIFDIIDTGAVSSLHIQPATEVHSTNAAFLVFMTPKAAQTFKQRGAWIRGRELNIMYNREGVTASYASQSRVLMVDVPAYLINISYWLSFFSSFCAFSIDRILLQPSNVSGSGIMEFRFARIEGQSRMCLKGIRESPTLQHIVNVSYGRDPCKP